MQHEIFRQLDEIQKCLFELRGSDLPDLDTRVSDLSLQVTLQRGFDDINSLIRDGKPLPVRRIGFNIKTLLKEQTRWSKLLQLDFRSLIFCTLSFQALVSLPLDRFNWLVGNVQHYLQVQNLPASWIMTDQIRRMIAKVPNQENTAFFWKCYHLLEINYHELELAQCSTRNSHDPRTAEAVPQDLHGQKVGSVDVIGAAIICAPETDSREKKKRNRPDKEVSSKDLIEPPSKNPRLGLQHVFGSGTLPEREVYFSFSLVKHDRIESLPELFLNGLRMSWSWKQAMNEGGLAITNCLSLHIPKLTNNDAIFQIKLDYDSGWKLLQLLGLGDG